MNNTHPFFTLSSCFFTLSSRRTYYVISPSRSAKSRNLILLLLCFYSVIQFSLLVILSVTKDPMWRSTTLSSRPRVNGVNESGEISYNCPFVTLFLLYYPILICFTKNLAFANISLGVLTHEYYKRRKT